VYGPDASPFPAKVEDVLGWSATFRCLGTFANYLSYVRSASCALGFAPPPVGDPAIRRAMGSVAKRALFTSRPRLFLQRPVVMNLIRAVDREIGSRSLAMLWLAAYAFLLRVPSEGLPIKKGREDVPPGPDDHSVIWLAQNGDVVLWLRSRKNRPQGSSLRRSCCCAACSLMCPVHTLWHGFFAKLGDGAQPWGDLTAAAARKDLRSSLAALRMSSPNEFGTHDFRRGHAKASAAPGVCAS